MSNISYHISSLLEKMSSADKDFRFMATNDLMIELQRDNIALDDNSERKIVSMILRLLGDKNCEVQNMAVKCLGSLTSKLKQSQIETIVDKLCVKMITTATRENNEMFCDIPTIGLKTVISELPSGNKPFVTSICHRITGKLLVVIEQNDDENVVEALDILVDLLSRFGVLLCNFHPQIFTCLQLRLCSQRQSIRKRSIIALSFLVQSCKKELCMEIIEYLLNQLILSYNMVQVNNTNSVAITNSKTYIQTIVAIVSKAGHRFGDYSTKIIDEVDKYVQNINDDELINDCLQAFEAILYNCPKQVPKDYIIKMITISLNYLEYDPNYNYDSDDDMQSSKMEVEEDVSTIDEDDDDESEDYSDDEDLSWKVRKSSAKCLKASFTTKDNELFWYFYDCVAIRLLKRFKERKENVKSEVISAYIELLKCTDKEKLALVKPETKETVYVILQKQVPLIIKQTSKLLREKSIKIRQDCFAMLKELVKVSPGCLHQLIDTVILDVLFVLKDKLSSTNLKIDALNFMHFVLKSHEPVIFSMFLHELIPIIIQMIDDRFYKISAEALWVMEDLVQIIPVCIRENPNNPFQVCIKLIHKSVMNCLSLLDIDQEVKERAISCIGQLFYNLGDHLVNEVDITMPKLLDRLKNEITRVVTLKALNNMATSPLKINFSTIINDMFPYLGSFLRKSQRSLKLSTLTLLDNLANYHSELLNSNLLNQIIIETPPLISESDLHVTQLTLSFLTIAMKIDKISFLNSSKDILKAILNLIKSPLLQGAVLDAVLEFFRTLTDSNLPNYGKQDVIILLTNPVFNQQQILHKHVLVSLAKCVASLATTSNEDVYNVVTSYISVIENYEDNDNVKNVNHLSFRLLVIGEIGRNIDLTSIPQLKIILLKSISSHSEEIKSIASYALGSIATQNLSVYLPFIFKEMKDGDHKRLYLLLNSLKEIITSKSDNPETVKDLLPFFEMIWTRLFTYCEYEEEGVRNLVAECLGKLTVIKPYDFIEYLKRPLMNQSSSQVRSTVIKSLKYMISDKPSTIDEIINPADFLLLTIHDPNLEVQCATLITLNAYAHNKPNSIKEYLPQLMPFVYEKTKIRTDLIREIEMGPFKHTIDDGFDLRKCAFECMFTVLQSFLDRLDISEFINYVIMGLNDNHDIKLLVYLMTERLITLCPTIVMQHIERIIEPLKATCQIKVKPDSVKQEFKKHDEIRRATMRVIAALLTIPDADKNPILADFIEHIKGTAELHSLFESVQREKYKIGQDQNEYQGLPVAMQQ